MSSFNEIISIGFDKNGEADYRITMTIADLSIERMKMLRQIIPCAIHNAEQLWWDHGPPSREIAAAKSEPAGERTIA